MQLQACDLLRSTGLKSDRLCKTHCLGKTSLHGRFGHGKVATAKSDSQKSSFGSGCSARQLVSVSHAVAASHHGTSQQPSPSHLRKPFQKLAPASSANSRHGTQLAAGSFMGLMGQILKDMAPAVPSGSSLTVDKICYHPAGRP